MISFLIIMSVILSIALGFKIKANIAIFGMSFAYLIGAFVLNMKPGAIISLFPTSLFFFLFSVTFFYGFALKNGTLYKFAENGIYLCRNKPFLIPIMLYAVSFIMSGVGAGPFAVFAFLAPLIMVVATEIGMNKVLAAMIIVGSGVAGGYTPISLCTATVRNVLVTVGYSGEQLEQIVSQVSFNNILAQFILFAIGYVVFKGYKVSARKEQTRPEPFTRDQKVTMILILVGLASYVLCPLLKSFFPTLTIIGWINSKLDTGLIAVVLTSAALILNIGKEKDALSAVPWNTIILICGMGMLIAVAKQAGAIESLSAVVGSTVSSSTAPLAMGVCGGIMSLFSSTLGVVAPTLGILVPGISTSTGVSPTVLMSIMMICGHFAGISPFSTGGAMSLAGVSDDAERDALMIKLIVTAVASIVLALLMTVVGIIR